jgi:hypothetical protein
MTVIATKADDIAARIEAYAAAHFPRFVDELKALCRIVSLSSDHDGLWRCADYLQDRLGELRPATSGRRARPAAGGRQTHPART